MTHAYAGHITSDSLFCLLPPLLLPLQYERLGMLSHYKVYEDMFTAY